MLTNLSIGRYGRFGNMLFQVCAVIGIARKSGQPYGFLPFINHDHKDRFGSSEDIELGKYFANPLPQIAGDYPYFQKKEYPWGYHDIHLPTGNWDISGHFQSEKYFKHCIEEVRHYMRMKGEREINFYSNTVAIHVRRGDYDGSYHPLLTAEYYKNAILQFPMDAQFLLFSDDTDKAMSLINEIGLLRHIQIAKGKDYIQEFEVMKQCGGFICANSSFSLMAAILSEVPNKKIVCPSNWFGPAWTIPMETKDLYPENSIVI